MLMQIVRAAILDGRIYEDIIARPESMLRALAIVAAGAIAFGLGVREETVSGLEDAPLLIMLIAMNSMVVGWLLWGFVAYAVGSLFGGKASFRAMLRSLGFVYGPSVLMVLFSVPSIGGLFLMLSRFWLLAAGIVAVSETHGYGTLRGFFPTVIGWYMALWLLPLLLLPIE